MAPLLQATLARALEPKLYPQHGGDRQRLSGGAARRQDAAKINPMELWDLHYIRKLDDSGFVDDLYKKTPASV